MISTVLLDQWVRDAAAPFAGWDFSYLEGRMIEGEPPWAYRALAGAAARRAYDILDVATGGGEVFSSFAPFPGRATAVEGYPPNLPVARDRLQPLGVRVLQANTRSGMPFPGESFDLVLNRHGGFRAAEMGRILKSGGVFLTQQVGGDNLEDLVQHFGARLAFRNNSLARVTDELQTLGFTIDRAEEWRGPVTFRDVGALIYFLKAVPWVVEGFAVDRHLAVLTSLHSALEANGPLQFTYTRYLLCAVKR
jgi:SAM-dependent methyltransferase